MFSYKRILTMMLAAMMLVSFAGCKEEEPPPPAVQPTVQAPVHEGTAVIETIPNPEVEQGSIGFINQLEDINLRYLLPLSFNIPNEQSSASQTMVSLGSRYEIIPQDRWVMRTDRSSNILTMYHDNEISVQFKTARFKGTFDENGIKKELELFQRSFEHTTDMHMKEAFIGSSHDGYETVFNIPHDDQYMCIHLGAVSQGDEILIWTINYLTGSEQQDPIKEDSISTAMTGLRCGSNMIVVK